ncbi:hypothetical protein Tco_0942800, partial [Tanacetum coccineum]
DKVETRAVVVFFASPLATTAVVACCENPWFQSVVVPTVLHSVQLCTSNAKLRLSLDYMRLINEDKGHQDVLLDLAFQFEDSCVVSDDLRKTYEKCNDISQESRALICTLLKESSKKDRKLHLSMYGKTTQLQKQIDAKSAWFQEKYFGRTHGGIGCLSSPTNCPMEQEAKEKLEEEA